eukprot:scaffold1398_cov259-Pinguiococcus_pyrenoidosus.AAC.3
MADAGSAPRHRDVRAGGPRQELRDVRLHHQHPENQVGQHGRPGLLPKAVSGDSLPLRHGCERAGAGRVQHEHAQGCHQLYVCHGGHRRGRGARRESAARPWPRPPGRRPRQGAPPAQ